MILESALTATIIAYLDAAKFWVGIAGIVAFGYKIVAAIKSIRVNDLNGLHSDIATNRDIVIKQTETIERGLTKLAESTLQGSRDLREDFRAFFALARPGMIAAHAPSCEVKKKIVCSKRNIVRKSKGEQK